MIDTEPFYVHSYVTEGTAGIIRENMLRRIFGNVPFESATLADVKFSKVPPRPWDIKKLSSFKEKFFSIPTEYQSYYPQVAGCQQIDQNLSKKRGRPRVEDIESSDSIPTQKVLGRKKTPVPLSALNSNSLLKYFGPKVAAALACPSRSMQNTSETRNIIPEILSDACNVVTSALSPQPQAMNMNIAIVEEAVKMYGLKWLNSSCAFDTVLTVMLYFCFSLSSLKRSLYELSLSFLGVDMSSVDISSPESLGAAKENMMRFFAGLGRYNFGTFYSLESVYDSLTGAIADHDDLLKIQYKITKKCLTPECEGAPGIDNEGNARQLCFFESCHKNDNLPEEVSTTDLISSHWTRRIHDCSHCSLPLNIERDFIGSPEMIIVSIAGAKTIAEDSIVVRDAQYSIFAVGYLGESHFIALIKHDGQVYEYDGQVNDGELRVFKPYCQRFKNTIIDSKKRIMKAQLVWYSKVV